MTPQRAIGIGLLVGVSALSLACSAHPATSPAQSAVPRGVWSGEHVVLTVTDTGARAEFDCAHGTIDEPLVLDGRGAFDATGTFVLEAGGPPRPGTTPPSRPARYAGTIEASTMTLTVSFPDTGEAVGRFTLVLGQPPRLLKCL